MDRTEFAAGMLQAIAVEEYESADQRIRSIGLVMSACGMSPSDDEWREMLLAGGVDIYDSEVIDYCIRRTNILHYSGILRLSTESSWLDAGSEEAFSMVVDEEAREEASTIRQQAEAFWSQIEEF